MLQPSMDRVVSPSERPAQLALMKDNPGLGLFAWLAPEIRLQIWQQFLPDGADTDSTRVQKTDLSILRASRQLYEEISANLYSNLVLYFDFSPIYIPRSWLIVHYQHPKAKLYEERTAWILRDESDLKLRGFHTLPYDRVDTVVSLFPPDTIDPGQFILLFQKVMAFSLCVGNSKSIVRRLVVRFRKMEHKDWHDDKKGKRSLDWYSPGSVAQPGYDHDMIFVPFCILRSQVHQLRVQAHSMTLKNALDWTKLTFTTRKLFRNLGMTSLQDTTPESAARDPHWCAASYFILIDQQLAMCRRGRTANMVRLERFSKWFPDSQNGTSSGYEDYMIHIIETYPDLIYQFDPFRRVLKLWHQSLVALYHHIRSFDADKTIQNGVETITPVLMPSSLPPVVNTWDQDEWYRSFPGGIPSPMSEEFHRCFPLEQSVYRAYCLRDGSLFKRFYVAYHTSPNGQWIECY